MHSRLPTKQHLLYTTLLYTETCSFPLLGTAGYYTQDTQYTRKHKIRVILYPSAMFYQTPVLSCCYQLLSVDLYLPRNKFKFENGNGKQNLKGVWTFLQNSELQQWMEGLLQNIFQAQQKSDQHVSSFQAHQDVSNISKIYAKKTLPILDRYTYI